MRGMDTRRSPEGERNGYEQLADREFSPDGIWKSRRLFMPPRYSGALTARGRHRVTFPFSQRCTQSPSASVRCLYWLR